MKVLVQNIFMLLVASMLIQCSANPVTGKKDFMLMSEKREVAIGKQSDPGILQAYGLYNDAKLQQFINQKGEQMAKISHRPGLEYEFKVVDSPVVNAFAVPGGFVYFTRGIMAHFNNEAEFAGVLGHEIGHITARHSAKQYSKSVVAQVGLVLGMVFSSEFRKYSDLAQQGVSLLFLKFGRDAESQSDKLGVSYSTKIGYDAHEMGGFFKTIKRLRSKSGAEIPTFLSTHPDPVDRFNKVNAMADQAQSGQSPAKFKVNRDSYLNMIDGLLYGDDPKQGYVENDIFYHPVLKFSFDLPRGWNTTNSPAQFQAVEQSQRAMLVLTLSGQQTLDAARQEVTEKFQIQITNSQRVQVNGLPAMALLGQSEQVRTEIYLIQYGGNIYVLTGVSKIEDFNTFRYTFSSSMKSFKRLTDSNKLNKKPEVLKIVTATKQGSFVNTMKQFKVASNRMEEHAILNGMEMNQTVKKGMKLKTVVLSK